MGTGSERWMGGAGFQHGERARPSPSPMMVGNGGGVVWLREEDPPPPNPPPFPSLPVRGDRIDGGGDSTSFFIFSHFFIRLFGI